MPILVRKLWGKRFNLSLREYLFLNAVGWGAAGILWAWNVFNLAMEPGIRNPFESLLGIFFVGGIGGFTLALAARNKFDFAKIWLISLLGWVGIFYAVGRPLDFAVELFLGASRLVATYAENFTNTADSFLTLEPGIFIADLWLIVFVATAALMASYFITLKKLRFLSIVIVAVTSALITVVAPVLVNIIFPQTGLTVDISFINYFFTFLLWTLGIGSVMSWRLYHELRTA